MKKHLFLFLALGTLVPHVSLGQDAHSMAIGGATAAAPMDAFGTVWNPALIALPGSAARWTLASGFSAFDTSNNNTPILRLTQDTALNSGVDPVNRYQDYEGLFTVRYLTGAGGVLFDQSLTTQTSQSAYQFFNDRSVGIPIGQTYNNLNYQETQQQIASLIFSYGQALPFGTMPVYVGASLKYEDGLQYLQNNLTGTYAQGVTTGYQYTRTTSSNGLGLSIDAGFLAQVTDSMQLGMMFENIQSGFSWTATQQQIQLDQNTGQETVIPGSTLTNQTLTANLPYITRLGLTAAPPGKNIYLMGEVEWAPNQTNWKFGLEHYYPESNMVVRLGTFYDNISQSQLWTFGWGVLTKIFTLDLAFETRSLPAIQDSIAVGGALDAEVRF